MTCAGFDAAERAAAAGAASSESTAAAAAHLAGCPVCQARRPLADAVTTRAADAYVASARLTPSPDFMSRVRHDLQAAAPAVSVTRGRAWLAIAASILVALMTGGVYLASRATPAAIASALATLAAHAAGDHRHCALHFALDEAPIPLAEAARLYDPGFAGVREAVEASPAVRDGSMEIVAAHSCIYQGRRFAHVVLRRRDEIVSVLVARESGIEAPARPAACTVEAGLSVACTQARGYRLFVVSALPGPENVAMARLLTPALQDRLSRL
ncbi:MAG: hypothetical protein ABIX28_15335 [Vicinamibacterales bacterium]